jgi:hypothetical protein
MAARHRHRAAVGTGRDLRAGRPMTALVHNAKNTDNPLGVSVKARALWDALF